MAQAKAYTEEQVIAAGKALRARGMEPTRTTLFNELGNKGQPLTAFAVWEKYRDRQSPKADLEAILSGQESTPEMTARAEAVTISLGALLDQVRKETAAPLNRVIAGLETLVANIQAKNDDLENLVKEMEGSPLRPRKSGIRSTTKTSPRRDLEL